jgi:endonuclease/exonuclease/phosphatase family metal-dependent hydrolase
MDAWPGSSIQAQQGLKHSIRTAYAFNNNAWTPCSYSPCAVFELGELSVVTWNVWFEDFKFETRTREIIRILKELDADFVCLQEVTPRFVQMICDDLWVQKSYCVSDCDGSTVRPYGVMMLTKFKVAEFHNFDFTESMMGRSLLVANYGQRFAVSTSHFESLNFNMNARIEQLRLSTEILRTIDHSIVCGDFNFSSDWMENAHIPEDFIDIWAHLHPEEKGFTMPDCGRFPAWRPDRILLRSLETIIPQEMIRIGEKPLEYPDIPVKERSRFVLTPSDHQGLYCKLKII